MVFGDRDPHKGDTEWFRLRPRPIIAEETLDDARETSSENPELDFDDILCTKDQR
jgi:hypothetical protein